MQSPNTSFYEILEVPRDASAREIRRSYLRLAQMYHPDLNAENQNADREFKRIREVYEILSDPIRRSAYDEQPANFHLDETDSWSTDSIVTNPEQRGDFRTGGTESFQPNWAANGGDVGSWLVMLAIASLAVAATVGVTLMLFMKQSQSENVDVPAIVQSKSSVASGNQLADPATTEQQEVEEVADPRSSDDPQSEQEASDDSDWWSISVYDPEESWNEGSSEIIAPEWTKLPVPELPPTIDDETPIVAPEWASIPVPELQPQSDSLTELGAEGSGGALVKPEWAEIEVPDLAEGMPSAPRIPPRPATGPSQSIGTLYQSPHAQSIHPHANMQPPAAQPLPPTIRQQVESGIRHHLRPPSLRRTLPKYLTQPRQAARHRDLFMSETHSDYPRRRIPPVSRYGGELPDVPPAYAVPTESYRALDR